MTKLSDATGRYIRYEYSSSGNAAKLFNKIAGKAEQLLEEFTSYDNNSNALLPTKALQLLYGTGIYSDFGINYGYQTS